MLPKVDIFRIAIINGTILLHAEAFPLTLFTGKNLIAPGNETLLFDALDLPKLSMCNAKVKVKLRFLAPSAGIAEIEQT